MCRILELAKLVGATAETILQTLLEVMDTRHLPVEKLFGIVTNGATVMTGSRSGIATCIKRKKPFVFSMHCIAHCIAHWLALAVDRLLIMYLTLKGINGI